jgi:hypothetical protein
VGMFTDGPARYMDSRSYQVEEANESVVVAQKFRPFAFLRVCNPAILSETRENLTLQNHVAEYGAHFVGCTQCSSMNDSGIA